MATAIASTHIRMRRQSPKFTMSVTAPIVQKFTRLATAPKTNASTNARLATTMGSLAAAVAIHIGKLSHAGPARPEGTPGQ